MISPKDSETDDCEKMDAFGINVTGPINSPGRSVDFLCAEIDGLCSVHNNDHQTLAFA